MLPINIIYPGFVILTICFSIGVPIYGLYDVIKDKDDIYYYDKEVKKT